MGGKTSHGQWSAFLGVLAVGLLGCQSRFDSYADDYMARNGEAHLERLIEKKLKERAAVAQTRPAPAAVDIPVGGSPVLGDGEGASTVVTFLDPTDPGSLKLYRALSELLPATQGVRWVVKLSPDRGNELSVSAATALLAAERLGRFEPYLRSVMEGQADLSEAALVHKALDLGLEQKAFFAARNEAAVQARLQEDQRWLDAHGGVRGSAFINGIRVAPRDMDRMALEHALTRAR